MEPRIPDGSLCVFRHGVTGSRQGRLVLVENLETAGNNRYTVKRYESTKQNRSPKSLKQAPGSTRAFAWNRSIPNIHPGISIPTKRNTASWPSSCACWIRALLQLLAASCRTTYGRMPPLR